MAAGNLLGLAVIALWVVAIIAAIVGGITLIVRRRRALGIGILATGAILLLAPVAWVAWLFYGPDMRTTLESNGLEPRAVYFEADVRHERLAYDGSATHFRYSGGSERLFDELSEAYPEGRVDGDAWIVAIDGTTFIVEPSPGLDGGPVQADIFLLTPTEAD
ncbi:hypothetical protein [Demequina sp. NBRC 110056]|uniref:hypothetical protein n=1 Tax=Demequina sp. NBRC 110056 TaxID=1570345 RepID=UPI000A05A36C|nr:hypothetical protein [Demequina sp. NBRC 110056]